MKLPNQVESIIVDEKVMGIWDVINLGNKGGIIHLTHNFAIEVTKTNQKWCHVYIHQFARGIEKKGQTFVAQKVVKDTEQIKQLKSALSESDKKYKSLLKSFKQIESELAGYKQSKLTTVSKDDVLEL